MPAEDFGTSTRPPHDSQEHLKVSSLIIILVFAEINDCCSKLEFACVASEAPNDKKVEKACYEGWCTQ